MADIRSNTNVPSRFCIVFVLCMISLSTFSKCGTMVGAQQQTEEDGYCFYTTSVSYSTMMSVQTSRRMKSSYDCGLFDWFSCTRYRIVYETSYEPRVQYRTKQNRRCCNGWDTSTDSTSGTLMCTKPPVITTIAPPRDNSTGIGYFVPTGAIDMMNNSLNGDITTLDVGTDVATMRDDSDRTSDETPGDDPVTADDSGQGSLFTGEKGRRNMIGLIVIIVVSVIVIVVVTAVIWCCCRWRKRHKKLSDRTSVHELELLNRNAMLRSSRVGESAYTEIPVGQQTDSTSQLETSLTRGNSNDVVSTNEGATSGNKGGNQYHEIADLLQAAGAGRLPQPDPPVAHSTNGGTHNNYAYAYADRQTLSNMHPNPHNVEGDETQASQNVELKDVCPVAEYAEVHKKKAKSHPDNDEIPSTIQSYITTILPDQCVEIPPNANVVVTGDPVPYDDVVIGTRNTDEHCAINDNPQPYGEVEFCTNTPRLINDNPEPYGDVEIGNVIPPRVINDNPDLYSDVKLGVGLPVEDHYNPQPYGEVGAGIHEGYDHVPGTDCKSEREIVDSSPGELGHQPASKENTEYNNIPRSTCQLDGTDTCDVALSTGYGVIYDQAAEDSPSKQPTNNPYSTLDKNKRGNKANTENRQHSPDIYDKLERQISATPSINESPDKAKEEQQEGKISPTYSKMRRSNSREDVVMTTEMTAGYGVLGDDRREKVPPEVYDRLDTSGLQLSAKVPVQEYKGYGRIGVVNGAELHPVNDYGLLDKSGNPPEGHYATIPNDTTHQSGKNYDKLHRSDNHEAVSENQTGHKTAALSLYDAPGAPVPIMDSSTPHRQDTLYENTPKGKHDSRESIGLKSKPNKKPLVTTIYDTPVSRVDSFDESTESDAEPKAVSSRSNYDFPASRISSLGTSQEEPYDIPASRISSLGTSQEEPPMSVNYDSPAKSRSSRPRSDQSNVPTKYVDMDRTGSRMSSASTGSYYEDMNRRSRTSRGSLDFTIPVGAAAITRQDTLYENTARENDLGH